MNTLVSNLSNLGYTDNGAVTNRSTQSALLDFFGMGAALRKASEARILELFNKAFNENAALAFKTLFYIRDVRDGQGERRVFRVVLKHLGVEFPELVEKNLHNIAEFGRWDDLFCLEGTPVEVSMFNYVVQRLGMDMAALAKPEAAAEEGLFVSLLGKWMPSENASSKESQRLARKIRRDYMEKTSAKDYRKMLSALRKHINVVEREMCAGNWDKIEYGKLPSRAGLLYRKAFSKHDGDRYTGFLKDVKGGKEKVNAGVLYPYDILSQIVHPYDMERSGSSLNPKVRELSQADRDALDAYWKALPDYLANRPHNGLAVVDTSGSMKGMPICVAASLGIYFAERNKGLFNNFFVTFSKNPEFQKVQGADIYEKVKNLLASQWQQNTDLQRVFDLLLETATANEVPSEEMPNAVYIISDMEFDTASPENKQTNLAVIREKYKASGYEMPELIFWNVNSRNNQSPIRVSDTGVKLVSGCSPEILRALLDGKTLTPYDLFLSVVNKDRYSVVVV